MADDLIGIKERIGYFLGGTDGIVRKWVEMALLEIAPKPLLDDEPVLEDVHEVLGFD
jgi:hypothetical protein